MEITVVFIGGAILLTVLLPILLKLGKGLILTWMRTVVGMPPYVLDLRIVEKTVESMKGRGEAVAFGGDLTEQEREHKMEMFIGCVFEEYIDEYLRQQEKGFRPVAGKGEDCGTPGAACGDGSPGGDGRSEQR